MIPSSKPKLLFLAGYFPPAYKSSGSVRGWNIARYLHRLGWEVIVVTPHPGTWNPNNLQNVEATEVELEREGITRVLTDYRWRFLASARTRARNDAMGRWMNRFLGGGAQCLGIDNWIGWSIEVEKSCSHLKPGDIDVILASGAPFISFRLANKLAKKLRCPYVLDYRDLWTSNPHLKKAPKRQWREEKCLLDESAAVTTISTSIAHVLCQTYSIQNKVSVITNGYDPDRMAFIQPSSFNHFAITYTGSVLPPERDIAPFMQVLKHLKDHHPRDLPDWKFHYYGPSGEVVQDRAINYGVLDEVVLHGPVPYETALSVTKGANLSLIITCVSQNPTTEEKGVVTGKIFEAIGMATPMLVIAPQGSDVRQVIKTAGGGDCFSAHEVESMVDYIIKVMYSKIPPTGNSRQYSWEVLSRSFDRTLKNVLESYNRPSYL